MSDDTPSGGGAMSDPTTLGTDGAQTLRERREVRVDHVHDIPFHERTTVECPDCGISVETGIYGLEIGPSFSSCWKYQCDAFHKFGRHHDAEETDHEDASSALIQTTLGAH